MYFIQVEKLSDLECQNDWVGCISLLNAKVNQNPGNSQLLCRLIAECWLILSDWDTLPNAESVDYSATKSVLIAATKYGIHHFADDVNFLWETGYMMNLFPYLFYNDNEGDLFSEFEQYGTKMLKKAHELNSSDQIVELLAMGFGNDYNAYCEAKGKIQHLIPLYFSEETAIERYFRGCLEDKGTVSVNPK